MYLYHDFLFGLRRWVGKIERDFYMIRSHQSINKPTNHETR